MAAIRVTDLHKSFGTVAAVDGVDFTVEEGEFFGLIGPNGAGKTTVLDLVQGLRAPDRGEILLLGSSPRPRTPALQRRIGAQLQTSAFFERLTAREQIHTFADLYGAPTSAADTWLERVGLEQKAAARTEDLSGGQAQRLAIACALVHEPEVVFLDEPTAALDPQARRNLWDLLRDLQDAGRTIVLTTHHLDEAEALCDRVAIMDHGHVLDLDTPAALVRTLDAPMQITVPGPLPEHELAVLPGVIDIRPGAAGAHVVRTRHPELVLPALAARDAVAGIQVAGASLEDVFLDRTGRAYRA